jgi:hypothetical protein
MQPNASLFSQGHAQRRRAATSGVADVGAASPLISLHVVRPSESKNVHLVAVAASGARLYFSTLSEQRYRNEVIADHADYMEEGKGGVGSSLTLVYIAMPPPSQGRDAVDGVSPFGVGAADVAPDAGREPYNRVVTASSSFGATILAHGVASDRPECRLTALLHDPLLRGNASKPFLRLHECVQDLVVQGAVVAIGERTTWCSLHCDLVYMDSGALMLPQHESCVAPSPFVCWDVRTGTGIVGGSVPDEKSMPGVGDAPFSAAGVDLSRASDAPAGNRVTASDYTACIVAQTGLLDTGVPAAHHNLMRRRLWGTNPGVGALVNEFTKQHVLERREFVVLTSGAIYKYGKRTPGHQVADLLARSKPTKEVAGNQPNHYAFVVNSFPSREISAMFLALACSRTVNAMVASRAHEAYRLLPGTPTEKEPLSVRFQGLLAYAARVLAPFWNNALFDTPPNSIPGVSPILLPRWSRDETSELQRDLQALIEVFKRHFPFVEDTENIQQIARRAGHAHKLGIDAGMCQRFPITCCVSTRGQLEHLQMTCDPHNVKWTRKPC